MATHPARVLVVQDDSDLAFGLKLDLEVEGLEVCVEGDGSNALSLPSSFHPDVIILDIMLPGLDGFELLRRWRMNDRATRIIILSARSAEADRVAGLRLGADDYITKPFSVLELIERVKNQLRRASSDQRADGRILWIGETSVDLKARTVRRGRNTWQIGPKEFALLSALVDAEGAILSRRVLLETVWEHKAAVDTNTVDYHVSTLRRKLEADPSHPRHLLTVRKAGFRLQR